MSEARRLIRRSRPRFWLYLAGPVLVGIAYGVGSLREVYSPAALALVAYFLLPANVFLYGINDVFDADIDAENPKKDGKEIRYEGNLLTVLAVAVSAVLGALLVGVLPAIAAPYLAGFLVLGAAYSAPPARFKARPFLDSLSNGLYVLPGAAAYAALAGQHPPAFALVGGWLWTMAMHTFSAVPDIEPDRRAGIRTTATVLGETKTLAYCAGCWLLAAGAFGLLDWRASLLLLVYPLLVVGIRVGDVSVERAYWWYPAVNTAVGMAFTVAGLWGVAYA